jgi:hypothetical protein
MLSPLYYALLWDFWADTQWKTGDHACKGEVEYVAGGFGVDPRSCYGAFFVRLLWVVCEPEFSAVVIGVLLYACNTTDFKPSIKPVLVFLAPISAGSCVTSMHSLHSPGFNIQKQVKIALCNNGERSR